MGTDGTMESPLFTIKLPLTQLRRVPSAPSGVTTTPAGMFRDVSVQADRGMIIDKEARKRQINQTKTINFPPTQVLDNYLVVKLHEAMFDMKAQLQLMEAQVASIAKQKESLERTLQAKTQYIRVRATLYCAHQLSKHCILLLPVGFVYIYTQGMHTVGTHTCDGK